ncbi:ATP-dependent DNA ligase LigD ligase module /ATP-dependent DNA ligase LigD phosphoesterase module /ATP-dependent DNA ligase LigD polymerase module [Cryobacterium psychrotolerans]|uniref:DNA ligase (ATP) n=1 Tax=Cryobacterium psychrotolerans TaxID=386301 RepID=A0A1G8YEY9_9MICO|nr:ATP-dependent DNA ligase [Cryobacterium psychrotolerans]TFD90957.1 ATP-dependent DNA ligase [Cryobacterium psychrotolerans]SDK01227.1 ATP-dependent DNA ligase LigD ligase module /ATP-dependent DNA ligase LigD phosphoesterase module /ATP-dependent DNA ligase LigD polymerase module [Cryobacterium psychrotolerans]
MAETTQVVLVGSRRIKLTNLAKVLYPETGTTKADVLGYYAAVADLLISHARNRPATRKRWVHGVGTPGEPGQMFFEKNLPAATPDWVKRGRLLHTDRAVDYPLVNDLATLTWLAQMAALEIHVPQWQFGRGGQPRNPDRLVLDLDPGEGATLAECAEVARLARVILRDMNLDPMPVTSGSKGIHLYAALDLSHTSDEVSRVAHELARALEADHPDLIVSDMKIARRAGKVLVDWSQNSAAKTTITPYSLRGTFRPMVAAPRTWRELASPQLEQLDLEQVIARMKHRRDPLEELLGAPAAPDDEDKLAAYRGKRNRARTPEPVPEAPAAASSGRTFVIQEHHARRLHHDLRLERDGVLVSWALPKGVPTDPARNHLAVHTEDHPLEYGSFEGTIPAGEYGAGEVTIWDRGEYELEKWRDDEVIATLRGEPGGGLGEPRRIALIRTGRDGGDKNWLIHLMKAATPPRRAVGATAQAAATATVDVTATATATGVTLAARGRSYSPMLAALGSPSDLRDEDEWSFEMKWDGIRAIAYLSTEGTERSVSLLTRNGNDVTAAYPEIVEGLLDAVRADSAVLDGEVVALNRRGRPDFGLLQTRMGLSAARDVRAARAGTPVHFMVFDLLERGGEPLTREPYAQRRRALEETVASAGTVHVPPTFDGDFAAAFRSSRDLGLEGVIAKELDGDYRTGRRSRTWLKLKHHRSQEVVIGGWRPGNGHRGGTIGALLLGIPHEGSLAYVGRVGTGFRDRDLADALKRLAPLERSTSPFADVPPIDARGATWVRPVLVGEVEFAEWTSSGRLRQPSWRGWRPEKSPADVVREEPAPG